MTPNEHLDAATRASERELADSQRETVPVVAADGIEIGGLEPHPLEPWEIAALRGEGLLDCAGLP